MTLLELLVVIAILAILASISAQAFRSPRTGGASADSVLTEMRHRAIVTGQRVNGRVSWNERTHDVAFLPDGRLITDSTTPRDPRTGLPYGQP